MRHDDYGHHHWKAEDMAAFLRDKTGINIEKVDRPSFSRSPLFPVVFLAAVLVLGIVAYNLYYAEFMKNLVLWVMGVLFVYWFSVSGGMHNIIRGVPLYYPDQEGKIKVSPAMVRLNCVSLSTYNPPTVFCYLAFSLQEVLYHMKFT